MGLGGIALADVMSEAKAAAPAPAGGGSSLPVEPGVLETLHVPARAKRVIFLFQEGGPSQLELLDDKPVLREKQGTELPEEVRGGQRLTGMTGNQSSLPVVGSPFPFSRHGESGTSFSSLLPHTAEMADDLCVIRSLHTDAINHGPAVTFIQTGSQRPGRPSIGAWLSYGLGSSNQNLPAFVVMLSKDKHGQPLASRLWGNGFLPSKHQGVQFRSGDNPILYLNNPDGIDSASRRDMLDALRRLHELQLDEHADPVVETRIAQYELAYRMQMSIPEVLDFSDEPEHVFEAYGQDSRNPGTYAANCLLARRLAEQGVRFIQLYHQGWDHHGGLPNAIQTQCRETDQASAALVRDLKQRGMLDETLVVWGGEFGRTNYCQGKLATGNYGRDHHPRCFSMWMAGGGIRGGMTHGETDPYGYNIIEKPVHVHDLQATLLHCLGIDHERLTYKYQGRRFRLTDVFGHVVQDVLA
ncbi:MAG: DUF1501 domain-containing protein, partial [Planctomycetaceae bacterium]|nr:DUF1501 domain-containing protein [Planctomycetaceae bacterium]